MKQAVSVSLGSDLRDAEARINLFGEDVYLRREGWNGDPQAVKQRFLELDGRVDAFGVGGIDLWVYSQTARYPLHSAHALTDGVIQTPVVDGSGLKHTLERETASAVDRMLGPGHQKRRVLLTSALDRQGMAQSFFEKGYDVLCGDLGFALGLPIPIRSRRVLSWVARVILPIVSRLPIHMIYPTGSAQNETIPKFETWYKWADIIAGDCLYIKRHMPDDMGGKIVITNTTTEEDRSRFGNRGISRLITTTPVLNGRSFGTNLFEAGLTAVAGKGRPLSRGELKQMITELQLKPEEYLLTP
ncbi:MAG: quinate 5-dehydrogenase [Chloroflexota bacterium]